MTWTDSDALVIEAAEIEINSACTRTCSYCPNAKPELRSDKRMKAEVFHRIIDELSRADMVGRLSFHLYGEPLLNPDLEGFIRYARPKLPNTFIVVFTNGDKLDETRYRTLLDAGADRLLVTRHSGRMPPPRDFQWVKHWTDLTLTGRGGTVAVAEDTLVMPCHAPGAMLIVTVTGDVLLCHEDAARQSIQGNLVRDTLRSVWFSPSTSRIKALLAEGRRREAPNVCAKCNLTQYALRGCGI